MVEAVTTRKYKLCLIGGNGVGKTSLIRRFVLDEFDDRYITTIGTKVSKKDVVVENPPSKTNVTLMIWDITAERQVSDAELTAFASKYKAPHKFTSAKQAAGVRDAFNEISRMILESTGGAPVD